jgi:hypothetical protein
MVSVLAVPQFGQVMVDSRIMGATSRIHETERRKDSAER